MNTEWKIDKLISLEGKVVIVTGGNSGLGFEAVKVFAEKKGKVIMASRSLERANEAVNSIEEDYKKNIVVMELDLNSQKSIKDFAIKFKEENKRLDILLNNAGIMMVPYGKTEDGFEKQFGINHLGHFLLTGLLLDTIISTKDSKIINISSNAHKWGKMDFNNLMFEDGKGYSPMKSYGRSKLANLLFTYELQNLIRKANLNIKVIAAHPGVSRTNLGRHMKNGFFIKSFYWVFDAISQEAYNGALPGIRAALDSDASGGDYFGPSGRSQLKGEPVRVQSNKTSHNTDIAKRLWEESEKLTGIKYDFGVK